MTEREFLSLYKTYHRRLFVFVNKKLNDVSVSEDVVQDVMMEFAEAVRENRQVDSINAYLYGIARHKVADRIRRKKLKQILVSAVPESVVNSCATLLFRDTVNQQDMRDSIKRILSSLPNDYALVIRLKYMEGLPVKHIASKLSLSFKAAESMLFRARKLFSDLYQSI